jgi:hypothetical protein
MWELIDKQFDHPLANLKSARKLLDNLPRDDASKLLLEISHWAEAATEPANEFKLSHQHALLRLLDETAHPYLAKVTSEYFSVQPPNAFHSNRLWKALDEYCTRIGNAYLSVLRNFRDGNKKSSAIKPDLPLITARAMVAVAGRVKCAALRYAAVEPQLWSNLVELYALAETQQYLDEPLSLYEESTAKVSVQGVFAAALMWQACATGSLGPLQIHIAERLTMQLSEYFSVDGQYVASSLLAFDLRRSNPPMRLNGESTIHPGMRFIGVSEAPRHLNALVSSLENGSVAGSAIINSGESKTNSGEAEISKEYGTAIVLEVARYLARCISATPPSRRNPRRKMSISIAVANGLSRLNELAGSGSNSIFEVGERWQTEDISANGFLCKLPAGRVSKLKIGELIGLQPEKVERWGAGIVRRLSRDAQNNLLIGVEMLSNQVIGVTLHDDDEKRRARVGEQRALYLNKFGEENEEAWLLMRPNTFSSKRSVEMTLGDLHYLLMPLELLRKGEDYDLARYHKMAPDARSAGASGMRAL